MPRNVIRITETQRIPVKGQQLRVAAYCRVSTKHEEQQQSLEAQIDYYTNYIQNHPNWVLVTVYSDTASGTRTNQRPGYQQLLKDCTSKKADMILVKSLSRFGRDATSLKVMEYVVGDEHTFDFWVQWTAPNGKIKAVRPKLAAWMDMRSRAILGDVACIDANSQTLKESLVKMIFTHPGGVPRILHIDNGKDYTSESMTDTPRKKRNIEFSFDAETVGFYQSIGIEEVGRFLPSFKLWGCIVFFFNL